MDYCHASRAIVRVGADVNMHAFGLSTKQLISEDELPNFNEFGCHNCPNSTAHLPCGINQEICSQHCAICQAMHD